MTTALLAPSFIWFREGLEAFLIIQTAWMLTTTHKQQLTLALSTLFAVISAVALGYFAIE